VQSQAHADSILNACTAARLAEPGM